MLTEDEIDDAKARVRKPLPRRLRKFWDVEGGEQAEFYAVARFWNRAHAEELAVRLTVRGRGIETYRAVPYAVN